MRIDTDQTTHGIVPPGFRLPESTTVGRVRLLVSDLTVRCRTTSTCSVCAPAASRTVA